MRFSTPAAAARFIDFIERRPQQAFAGFLVLHGVVWTALPALFYANLPLDLIEALIYGREWQVGYDKLPPLPWWLVEIAHRTFNADTAYYALAQIAVVIAFVLVYATARPLVGTLGALASVLIIDGLHYFQYTAVKFNHDVVQLPFWALAGYSFHAALKRGRLLHWFLLGVAFGGALWAKYFVVMLAVPYVLFMFADRDARRALATPGPWLALAVALLIAAPHVIWLFQTDFLPFAYASHRAAPVHGFLDHLWHPAQFAGSQIFFALPALFIALAMFLPKPLPTEPTRHADAFDRRIVTLLAFGPALTTIALTAISGRGAVAMWGYPLWLFTGLWLVMAAPAALDKLRLGRLVTGWAVVFAIFIIVFVANYLIMPPIDHRYRAVLFPGDKLGPALTQRFHDATGAPLTYVIGSMWDGGNLAHYSPDQPRVLIDGALRRAPWIDLADLRKKGAIVVWTQGDDKTLPPQFADIASGAQVGTPFDLPMHNSDGTVHVGWVLLKPQ
ncbi:MAG TPA: glycosyltransferase family 39 protein [Xanthobacteraceae bacterium]|jgi:4-amino-4-deoxy-L-arabinose transferase-like glycosyltransferase|nr:glycosyltransferase family 39 protein [Xanthobacteraceae bacterium]